MHGENLKLDGKHTHHSILKKEQNIFYKTITSVVHGLF